MKPEEKNSIYYHQTTPERADALEGGNFRMGIEGAARSVSSLRGTYLKEMNELLQGAGIGQSQVRVELDSSLNILDLTSEAPPSFVRFPKGIDANELVGSQDYALTGWLERNGHPELAERYQGALKGLEYSDTTRMDNTWPEVEQVLRERGYGGVRLLDAFIEGEKQGEHFPAVVLFDNTKVLKISKE